MTFYDYLDNLPLTAFERRSLYRDLKRQGVHYFKRSEDLGISYVVGSPPASKSPLWPVLGCILLGAYFGWILGVSFVTQYGPR